MKNNAFKNDPSRFQQSSIGLGGNISQSLYMEKNKIPNPRFIVNHNKDDSGNGSLMRLSAISILTILSTRSIISFSSFLLLLLILLFWS